LYYIRQTFGPAVLGMKYHSA